MPAGGFKTFTSGEILTAADVNSYLMQGVLVFAGTAARGSALPSPQEGQFSFRTDEDAFEVWDGSAWVEAGGVPTLEASGGSEATSGGFKTHTFTSSGTLTVSKAGVCDILIIGGGGGGGVGTGGGTNNRGGGGGGAGGYCAFIASENTGSNVSSSGQVYLNDGSISVVIGAGGAGQTGTDLPGASGSGSRIGSLTAAGGGGGGRSARDTVAASPGFDGGSGGGAGANQTSSSGAGFSGQGQSGGVGAAQAGGGGGGAGVAGSAGTTNNGGDGGNGLASSISGSSVTRAGGGGGGGQSTGGAGGSGGGGAGGTDTGTAGSGTANTGGGGGGNENSSNAGNGGSGIVIVRYAV